MSDLERVRPFADTVRATYGSLECPDYSFMEKRYRALLRHQILYDLLQRYLIKDETDLNDHAALHLRIEHAEGADMLCLSCVGAFAMLFRMDPGNAIYEAVVDTATEGLWRAERDILALLEKYAFHVLSKCDAALHLDMQLFNTEREECRVYHAVISDDGVIPHVLLK